MCAAVADTTFFLEQAKDEALAGLPDTEFAGRAKDDDARRLLEKLAVKSVGTSSSGPRLSGIEPARFLCVSGQAGRRALLQLAARSRLHHPTARTAGGTRRLQSTNASSNPGALSAEDSVRCWPFGWGVA